MLSASLHNQSCISHVINLCVKSCMKHIHKEVLAIRDLMNSLRVSAKLNDLFEVTKIKLGQRNASFPVVDVETRWSSTFEMLLNTYTIRTVLNAVDNHIPKLLL